MTGYIKREDFCKEIDKGDLLVGNNAEWAKEIALRTPDADVEEVRRAHWEPFRDTIKCSKCGFGFFPNGVWFQDGVCIEHNNFDFRPDYCPGCGAKMDTSEDKE